MEGLSGEGMAARTKKEENMTIEEGFEKLSDILSKMDEEGVSLENSFKLYNDGLAIVKKLNGKLEETEQRLNIINEEININQ